MTDRVVRLLESWLRLMRAVEALLVDVIAASAPWLAPILPAYMAYESMSIRLGLPVWVALAGAGVVELLGLSSVSTVVQFWDYNDSARKTDQRAPVIVALVTAGFYLAVVLTVNVLMDPSAEINRLAKGLLSSLSVCAAVILALRSGQARRIRSIEVEKQERRELRLALRKETETSGNLPESSDRSDWRKLPVEDRELMRTMTTAEISQRYQVSDRTARNWKTHSISRGNGHDRG